jgi:hypothetical protein
MRLTLAARFLCLHAAGVCAPDEQGVPWRD